MRTSKGLSVRRVVLRLLRSKLHRHTRMLRGTRASVFVVIVFEIDLTAVMKVMFIWSCYILCILLCDLQSHLVNQLARAGRCSRPGFLCPIEIQSANPQPGNHHMPLYANIASRTSAEQRMPYNATVSIVFATCSRIYRQLFSRHLKKLPARINNRPRSRR